MMLKSFGCSFIYGSGLSDENSNIGFSSSCLTWPALIAKKLGTTYNCCAQAGKGNLFILERIIEQSISSGSNDIFVIGWTWIDRFDYFNGECDPAAGPTSVTSNDYYTKWNTILPVDNTKKSNFYYKNFHSEYQDKLKSLIYIKCAIDILLLKRIPFIMTNIDNLIFDTQWNTNDTIKDLQDSVAPYISTFNNMTFLDWSVAQRYKISPTLHPLEEAHAAAAKFMLKEIKKSI